MLASSSEIRQTMLRDAGILFEAAPANIDERAVERQAQAKDAAAAATLLAGAKAQAIAGVLPDRLVLGADQTLSLARRRFSKPPDLGAAREQLRALRGRTHELHSAAVLVRSEKVVWQSCEVARLTMRDFSDDFLDAYLDHTGAAVTRSVGAYQLEKAGVQLFERIEGDHFVILGLPLLALLDFLRGDGLLAS
ncbi:MAG: Maf family protein [Xanthobacteraceae bacterium]